MEAPAAGIGVPSSLVSPNKLRPSDLDLSKLHHGCLLGLFPMWWSSVRLSCADSPPLFSLSTVGGEVLQIFDTESIFGDGRCRFWVNTWANLHGEAVLQWCSVVSSAPLQLRLFRAFDATSLQALPSYSAISVAWRRCVNRITGFVRVVHQRQMSELLLLHLRYDKVGDPGWGSVTLIRYLQLYNLPQVHKPERLPGEPPERHQLASTFEALEGARRRDMTVWVSKASGGGIWDIWGWKEPARGIIYYALQ